MSKTPKEQHSELKGLLQARLDIHGARADFTARFILALLSTLTLCLGRLGRCLNPKVDQRSNEQRIRRFLDFDLAQQTIASMLLKLFPATNHVLSIDRTEHRFGQTWVNPLVVGICWKGISLPLLWSNLAKKGCSSNAERLGLIDGLLKLLQPQQIACLVADREFASKALIAKLKSHSIAFSLRCKFDNLVKLPHKAHPIPMGQCLKHRPLGQVVHYSVDYHGFTLNLVALRLTYKDSLILLTTLAPQQALDYYKLRWNIETLFAAFKTRGFNFESTHLTQTRRIDRLIGLMTLALAWVVLVGDWASKSKPIPIKKYKNKPPQPLYSLFSYGLIALQPLISFGSSFYIDWHSALSLL